MEPEVIREQYYDDSSGGQDQEMREGEEEEEERELTWRKLPNIYLKLSKSRLTGMMGLE